MQMNATLRGRGAVPRKDAAGVDATITGFGWGAERFFWLSGLGENFSHFREGRGADPLDALENSEDPVGEIALAPTRLVAGTGAQPPAQHPPYQPQPYQPWPYTQRQCGVAVT